MSLVFSEAGSSSASNHNPQQQHGLEHRYSDHNLKIHKQSQRQHTANQLQHHPAYEQPTTVLGETSPGPHHPKQQPPPPRLPPPSSRFDFDRSIGAHPPKTTTATLGSSSLDSAQMQLQRWPSLANTTTVSAPSSSSNGLGSLFSRPESGSVASTHSVSYSPRFIRSAETQKN